MNSDRRERGYDQTGKLAIGHALAFRGERMEGINTCVLYASGRPRPTGRRLRLLLVEKRKQVVRNRRDLPCHVAYCSLGVDLVAASQGLAHLCMLANRLLRHLPNDLKQLLEA